jgi:hypothetical protein
LSFRGNHVDFLKDSHFSESRRGLAHLQSTFQVNFI